MNIKEELLQELKDAMKNKNELKKDTITMLRASILQVEKDTQKELTQTDIEVIVSKEIKKRQEAIAEFEKGNREDLAAKTREEVNILSKYLPEQLTALEVENLVNEAVKETGATGIKDMGKVMGYLRPKTAGKADGKLVSDLVKEILGRI